MSYLREQNFLRPKAIPVDTNINKNKQIWVNSAKVAWKNLSFRLPLQVLSKTLYSPDW